MAVFYEDQSLEVYDLDHDLDNPLYFVSFSEHGLQLKGFALPRCSSFGYSAESLFLLLIDDRNRLFRFGPIFWPKTPVTRELLGELGSSGLPGTANETLTRFLSSLAGSGDQTKPSGGPTVSTCCAIFLQSSSSWSRSSAFQSCAKRSICDSRAPSKCDSCASS